MAEKTENLKEKYRAQLEGSSNGIYVFQDGEFKFVNQGLVELTGYSRGELKNIDFLNLVRPDYREDIKKWTKQALTGDVSGLPKKHEFKALRKDGSSIWVQLTPSLIEYDGKPAVVGNVADISERKEAEEKLRKSREKYRTLTETADEIILTHGMGEIGITFANKGAAKQLGYEVEELLEMNLYDLLPEDEHGEIKEIEREREAGDASVYHVETKGKRKDGTVFPVEASSKPISVTDSGKPEEILVIARNITERKKAEEREKFLHSLLRHDVKNKIQIIRGCLELAEEKTLPEEAEEYLEKAEKATKDSSELIEKVRTLRKLNREKPQIVDLEPMVEKAVEKCKRRKSEIQFGNNLKCPVEGCRVKGGPLLHEIFYNILENSVKHSGGNKVKITNRETEEEMIFTIEDNGKGIPDEEKQKIFEKGYTKDEKAGAGLGSYLAKEIVKTYGGNIEVKDSDLGGARFDIHLQKA